MKLPYKDMVHTHKVSDFILENRQIYTTIIPYLASNTVSWTFLCTCIFQICYFAKKRVSLWAETIDNRHEFHTEHIQGFGR